MIRIHVEPDLQPTQPTTYLTQLYAAYIRENQHNPKKLRYHHAQELVEFVQTCQLREEWVIVAGDFNEVMGLTATGLTQLHSACGLIDAVSDRHGDTNFTTYQWGKSVIDYILVDPNIFHCMKAVEYEPFNVHILSDHWGIFMDLSTLQSLVLALLLCNQGKSET